MRQFTTHRGFSIIADHDLEKSEFDMIFRQAHRSYASILENIPVHHAFINYPEGEYVDENEDNDLDSEDDEVFEDRDSYRNADQDDVYYLI